MPSRPGRVRSKTPMAKQSHRTPIPTRRARSRSWSATLHLRSDWRLTRTAHSDSRVDTGDPRRPDRRRTPQPNHSSTLDGAAPKACRYPQETCSDAGGRSASPREMRAITVGMSQSRASTSSTSSAGRERDQTSSIGWCREPSRREADGRQSVQPRSHIVHPAFQSSSCWQFCRRCSWRNVDVVGIGALDGGWHRTAVATMCAVEHGTRSRCCGPYRR